MVYLCLPNIESSRLRVAKRIAKNGHPVTEEKLKYNYEKGLKNLDNSYMEFNSVQIFEADMETGNLFLSLRLKKGFGIVGYTATPECFNEKLTPNLLKLIREFNKSPIKQ